MDENGLFFIHQVPASDTSDHSDTSDAAIITQI